ncbi:cystathionine gamma-synthase [Geomonas sp. Red276]
MKFATELIHGKSPIDPEFGSLSHPIYHSSTFAQRSMDEFGRYDYARSGNPTREAVEEAVAGLEGGTTGLAFASGMAAIGSTFMIFSPGDHLVVCEDVYGGTFRLLSTVMKNWGLEATFVDATDTAAIAAAVTPRTKALYLETPSNPLLKVTDLKAAAALAKEKGLLTTVDNTFMTPYLQRPLELGCDIVLHSGTKFLNGHSDVICGFAVARDPELGKRLKYVQNAFGAVLGPQDCWLVLRGLRTLKVRMEESQAGAIRIVEWLKKQEKVVKIYYPGLPEHPGYEAHRAQSSGPGAVLSFELDSYETAAKLVAGVKLAAFAVSLGGVESILSYPAKMSHAAMPPAEREARGIKDTLVRLSVGLEDPEDLIADLAGVLGA